MNKFLISCTNDSLNGGIFLLDIKHRKIEKVYSVQCMGLAIFQNMYIVASQSLELSCPLEDSRGLKYKPECLPHSIVCLDQNFNILSEAPLFDLGCGDLHDIAVFDNKLWLVDTWANRVICFSIEKECLDRGLLFGHHHFLTPIKEWRDPNAKDTDSSHINGIAFVKDRIWITAFGRFHNHRGYVDRNDDGCILDITDHLRPFGSEPDLREPTIVKNCLSDPHSLTLHNNDVYFIESRKGRILKNWLVWKQFDLSYMRGLLLIDDYVYIGNSLSRHGERPHGERAEIIIVNCCNKEIFERLSLPAKEVYSILPVME